MRNDLKTTLDERLRGLEFQGAEAVMARVRGMEKRGAAGKARTRRALVIALALTLVLCGVAAALTLRYSERYRLLQTARDAAKAAYGLNDDMLDLFTPEYARADGEWTVRFTAYALNPDAMGVYTVTCPDAGEAKAAWSHDAGGAEKWDAAHLQRVITLRNLSAETWSAAQLAQYDDMTLCERAALDAPLLACPQAVPFINISPEAADLQPGDAAERAMDAIAQKYGVTREALGEYSVKTRFYLITSGGERQYRLFIEHPAAPHDIYAVYVSSPSGDISENYCKWFIPDELRALPSGDLALYPDAAREWVDSGAFDLLSAADKALAAHRFMAAGLAALLPEGEYVSPVRQDITEEQAVSAAQKALADAYGLAERDYTLFALRTALVESGEGRAWRVSFIPVEQPNWRWRSFDKLGEYTALIRAADGAALQSAWSLEGADAAGYTAQTFGQAPAYGAYTLPWIHALLADLREILSAYPDSVNIDDMTIADCALYSERMRKAGYSASEYPYTTPPANGISQEAAQSIAAQTLLAVYGLDEAGDAPGRIACYLRDERVLWSVYVQREMDGYSVTINALTGEIEEIWHDSPSSGNG